MMSNWRNWCRLCAKIDSCAGDLTCKVESISDQLEIIQKYFMISLSDLYDIQLPVCPECCKFLTKVDGFRGHCIKVDQMFKEIISLENSSNLSDLESIRIRFGVDSEEIKFSTFLSQSIQVAREDSLLPSIFAEPLEMQNTVEIKSEIPEIENLNSKRKCTRKEHNEDVITKSDCTDDIRNYWDSDNISDREFECNSEKQGPTTKTNNDKIDFPKMRPRGNTERQSSLSESYFVCAFCSTSFKRKNFLKRHILTKHQQKSMINKFSMCSKEISTRTRLDTHKDSKLWESKKKVQMCSFCNKMFKCKLNLQVHLDEVHKVEGSSRKFENPKKTETETSRNKEIFENETISDIIIVKKDYKSQEKQRKCKTKERDTEKTSGQQRSSENQTQKSEVLTDKKEPCLNQKKQNKKDQADKSERPGSTKDANDLSRKRPWERNRECSFCSRVFKRRNALREHILSRHTRQDMIHLCSKCPKKFSAKYRLRLHELTHLSKAERLQYQCPHCDSIFMQKGGLQSHINSVHLRDKPFICEKCGKGFGTKGALISHKLTHSDDRPFACSVCQKKFKSKRNCQIHETIHSGSGFPCSHCNMVLKSKGTHWLHMRVHSNVKKYKCNYCGNEYKHSQTLKDHLIWHTGQRPYECPFCDKTFSNGSNYRSHKNKAHAAELAALKASGKQLTAPKVPRLEHLQPKPLKMIEHLQSWCRLCAKTDSIDVDTVYKMELVKEQLEIVNKCFSILLQPFEDIQSSICGECRRFLIKVDGFRDHCLKADQMFRELLQHDNISDVNLSSIRIKYGFDNEEIKYSPNLPEVNDEVCRDEAFHSDTFSDPLESSNISVKEEILETEPKTTHKKRGRPRKSSKAPEVHERRVKRASNAKHKKNYKTDSDEEMSNEDMPDHKSEDGSDYEPETTNEPKEDKISASQKPKKIRKQFEEQRHLCTICQKTFCRRNVLKQHILAQHRKQDMTHECAQCSKKFCTSYRLKIHEATHLSDDEKRIHPCSYCDKKFSNKFFVQTHIKLMHIRDKLFTCEECGKSFGTKGTLTQHKISHTEERPCQCSFCPKKFKNDRQLKQHESSHKESGHPCPQCGLKLKSIVTLRMHLLVHSDKKNYKCNYCGNEYKRVKTLKSHLLLHTGQRPYECPFCDKTFANGSNCRSHKKKAHPVELAALEASGEQPTITITPKLKHLQPKVPAFT
ncbi:zinc finger protein 99-like [Phlebotomus papatasi]|uniref:zinc finger protein 99-like n=1 Tax=Phlebotomus papatasi TaxID=29031 RepID=UPI0024837E7C|nr:zinc finger protein 99-like [Phlebotomus papatasi]